MCGLFRGGGGAHGLRAEDRQVAVFDLHLARLYELLDDRALLLSGERKAERTLEVFEHRQLHRGVIAAQRRAVRPFKRERIT